MPALFGGLTEWAIGPVETPDGPKVLPALSCELSEGRVGWYQRHDLDCLRAAVATAAGFTYDEVPEMRGSTDLERWATEVGLRVRHHHPPPPGHPNLPGCEPPAGIWVADSGSLPGAGGYSHCCVMRGLEIVFNPDGWIFWNGSGSIRTTCFTSGWSFYPKEPK